MVAFNLIRHAFRMIFTNFGQALRVSVGPYAILLVVAYGLVSLFADPAVVLNMRNTVQTSQGSILAVILAILIMTLFVSSWVAVSWHRFILLEEYSGILPSLKGRPIWSYVGKGLLLGLIVLFAALIVFFVLGLVATPFMGSGGNPGPVLIALSLISTSLISFISLRLGVALPGTAVDNPLSFGEAWNATGDFSGPIFGVAIMLTAINILPGILLVWVYAAAPMIGFSLDLALYWLTIMLGITVLTTLYGHIVERRKLPD